MFDYNMILLDGSVDLTAATDSAAASTTRSSSTGAVVIDLGVGGTPACGLTAVLACIDSANGSTDTLDARIEACDSSSFGSNVMHLGAFGILNATQGRLLGSEVPANAYVHFVTDRRYVRLNATVGASPDSFGTVYCYITDRAFPRI